MKKSSKKNIRPLNRKGLIYYLENGCNDHFICKLRDIGYQRNKIAPLNDYQESAFRFVEHLLEKNTEREVKLYHDELEILK